MADERNDEGLFTFTKPVIGSFPNLLEARSVTRGGKPTGDPKYSLSFEFDPDSPDFQAIKALAVKLALQKWPGRNLRAEVATSVKTEDGTVVPKAPTFLFPWANGDQLAAQAQAKGKEREWSRGKVVLTARSKFQPNLSVLENGRIVDLEDDAAIKARAKAFYTGAEYLARVNLVPYDGVPPAGADGVTAYLQMVLSLNKGTKLVKGGASATEVFKGVVGQVSNEDVLAGVDLDDEIPF